jgi:MFS transporter, ACS family, D-galactonate transporter
VNERGFSMSRMGNIGGAIYGTLAATAFVCGWAADFWLARGGSLTVVRKTFTALGLAIASVSCLAVELVASESGLTMVFLFLIAAGAGLCTSNLWAITQTIAGPQAAGKWTGLQNFAGNLAGVVSPALTGMVVDRTGHFFWAFVVAATVLLVGSLSWVFVVGRVEPVVWRESV